MEKILRTTEKFIPKSVYHFFQPAYHFLLALAGAVIYRFPSDKLIVVGVTGTKGKSSTAEILNHIFEGAGYKTALSGTIRFKIGDQSRPNMYKMSMPGRMFMQKFLREAVDAGCTHAVIEMTSEGAKQLRHYFIGLNALIVTNISPEHIESHGSYENYVDAKLSIARTLEPSWMKEVASNKKGLLILNGDDKEYTRFRAVMASQITYSLRDAEPYSLGGKDGAAEGITMSYKGSTIHSPLRGLFNIYNILAAATAATHLGIPTPLIADSLASFDEIKGRVEKIHADAASGTNGATARQDFDVIVDYAHTADSLEKLYQAFPSQRKICVLGSTGGGRDQWKRPEMGKVADRYCNQIILTNEDPYDEDPMKIIDEVKSGITTAPCEVVLDRREAIARAISLAASGNAVLITGKGTDPYIMTANGGKIPWSDATVAKEELTKLLSERATK